MYGGLESQPQLAEWTRHMETLNVHHFHVYYTRRNVRYSADTLLSVWEPPEDAQPSLMLPGLEWVHVDTFDKDFRYCAVCAMAGMLLLRQQDVRPGHCIHNADSYQ